MTTVVAGLGPAGRGLLSALHGSGLLPQVVAGGLVVVEPSTRPGGGALHDYNVRSDSAAIVFAECVQAWRSEPVVRDSTALAEIIELPEGESIALPSVGRLLAEATAPLLQTLDRCGADVRLGSRVAAVHPRVSGGAVVDVVDADGHVEHVEATAVVLGLGGVPQVPGELTELVDRPIRHSDELLRPAGLQDALDALPADPRIVVVGRAHSAFAVTDRLLSSTQSRGWGPGALTVATRGQVRVTYASAETALRDGAAFTADDICPQTRRVWRLCGLRGDSALRYRLGRDGLDPRLLVADVRGDELRDLAATADLVVAATGYRSASHDLLPGTVTRPDGALLDPAGRVLAGIRSIGLGSGSRRSEVAGGEPSYDGPVDGVWHYQHVVGPAMVADLFGGAWDVPAAAGIAG